VDLVSRAPPRETGNGDVPLEEARHADAGPTTGGRPKIGRTGMLTRDGDVRVHGRGPGLVKNRGSLRERLVAPTSCPVRGLCHRSRECE
jgi:hypothetical protein